MIYMNNFSKYLNLFFNDYLILQLNCSDKTIDSYKYAFKLLLNYLITEKKIKLKNIDFNVLTKDNIKDFLNYLENDRNCSIETRNQRLAAIKSFFQFVGIEKIEYLNEVQGILNIKSKKVIIKEMDYLTLEEIDFFFEKMPKNKRKDRRNYVFLVLLYDSAARLEELLNAKVYNIKLDNKPSIILLGKGGKERNVPIMDKTAELVKQYINENKLCDSSYLFCNSRGEKLNPRTIQKMIKDKNTTTKKITPHSFRRSRAIHLLEAGVDIIYIRDLLDHASVVTTERYAKASPKYKNKMLAKAYPDVFSDMETSWNQDKDLLEELLKY